MLMTDNLGDGITIYSTVHPIAPWYQRLWRWISRDPCDIHPDHLVTVEIEISEAFVASALRRWQGVDFHSLDEDDWRRVRGAMERAAQMLEQVDG